MSLSRPPLPAPIQTDMRGLARAWVVWLNDLWRAVVSVQRRAALFNEQTGTTYTFTESDVEYVTILTNAAAIAATIPSTVPKGWAASWIQGGAGQVTFAGGATIQNRQSHTKAAGQYARGELLCISNTSGTNAVVVLSGDTAP